MIHDAFGFPIVPPPLESSPTANVDAYDDSELVEGLLPLSSPSLKSFMTLASANTVPRSFGSSFNPQPSRLVPSSSSLTLASLSSLSNFPPTPQIRSPSSSSVASSPAAMFLSSFSPITTTTPLPDAVGQTVPGCADLTLGAVLARGGTSVVRLASSSLRPTESSAVKIITLPAPTSPHAKRMRRRITRERDLWSSLRHEHILPLFSSTLTSTHAWFVTIPCRSGSLVEVLRSNALPGQRTGLPSDLAGRLGRQTVCGLMYLHGEGLVHRDIKLDNVLVDDAGQARIADFGLAIRVDDVDHPSDASNESDEDEEDACSDTEEAPGTRHAPLTTRRRTTTGAAAVSGLSAHPSLIRPRPRHLSNVQISRKASLPSRPGGKSAYPATRRGVPGSLPYAAPELLRSQPAPPAFPQDVWALGCVLHALLTGVLPFEDTFEPRLIVAIQCGEYVPPHFIPAAATSILRGCFDRNPATRITASDIDITGFAPDTPGETLASVPEDHLTFPNNAVILEDDEESDGESEAPLRTPSASRSPLRTRQPSREWEESVPRNRSRSVEVVHAFLRRVRRSMSRDKGNMTPESGAGSPKGKRTPSMVRRQTTPLSRRSATANEFEDDEGDVKELVDVFVEEAMMNRGRSGRSGRWTPAARGTGAGASVPPLGTTMGGKDGEARARSEMRVL